MNVPTLYLISRKLSVEQIDDIRAALSITPLSAVVTPDIRDEKLAAEFGGEVTLLNHPIAILADFDEPLIAVNSDGSLCPVPIPSSKS